jgi:L-lactate dehydrogenase complex protein LldF
MKPRVEAFGRDLPQGTVDSVRAASAAKVSSRTLALSRAFDDVEAARTRAASIKDDVLDHLEDNLRAFESKARERGIIVHRAATAEAARQQVLQIISAQSLFDQALVVKGKSMATEEIHLNQALESAGLEVVETDLGEFVVQIDGDLPSHIVTPIIHKNRYQVARSFEDYGLGPYTDDPTELASQAREHLRMKFKHADIGISGVNFGLVKEGALVIVENEGNNRLSTTAPAVHIAVMGIEKLLPSAADLPLFLRLLAGSATGQRSTVYTHVIRGPRRSDEIDGPREVHVILLDNGRTTILNSPNRDILRCIRCGACLNVCPVYRQVSGHGYRHTYSGPLGAVLAPALDGVEAMGDLAKASTLCGACEEVCPVKIPIPDMLLRLRDKAVRNGAKDGVPWAAFASGASNPTVWKVGLTMLPMVGGAAASWTEFREAPRSEGRSFRDWWNRRPKK